MAFLRVIVKAMAKFKKIKLLILAISIFAAGFFTCFFFYPKVNNKEVAPAPIPIVNQRPDYVVDIPVQYFDTDNIFKYGDTAVLTSNMLDVSHAPVAIPKPDKFDVIDEEYNPKEKVLIEPDFGPSIMSKDIDNDGDFENNIEFGESVDVDNDGRKEKIFYGSIAMNHGAAKVVIIKDGRIIYKSKERAGMILVESESHNGFYISETIESGSLFGIGAGRITRFISENGAFYPVWYKDSFQLQTTKP